MVGFRATCTAVAVVILLPTLTIVIGGYLPRLPIVGPFGGLIGPSLPGIMLASLIATILSLVAIGLGGRRISKFVAAIAIVTLVGTTVIVGQVLTLAGRLGATIDIVRAASDAAWPGPTAGLAPDRITTFPTVDGSVLAAEIWARPEPQGLTSSANRPGIVFVHGGGFVGGGLRSRPAFFRFLADAGIPVVDVEYRLSPPPRWSDATSDIRCALGWVRGIGTALRIDPAKIVLIGYSAGGNLALMAAYSPRSSTQKSSCDANAPVPAAVVAIAPAADLRGIWEDGTIIAGGLPFPEAYIGGPPDQYPYRYEAATPSGLLRPGLPPTLLIGGANDQLVFPDHTRALAVQLATASIACNLVMVPFGDHGFDGPPNAYGSQLEESILPAYIGAVTGGSGWAGPGTLC